MFEVIFEGRRKRDWIPKPPAWLSDPVAMQLLSLLTWAEEAEPNEINDYEEKKLAVEENFRDQFQYHSKWPVVAIITISFLLGVDLSQGPVNIQIYGLLFDMTGAMFLALGIIRGKSGLARDTREAVGRLGSDGNDGGIHHASLKANIADTIDGLFGAIFLIMGFMIQIGALWG